MESVHKPQTQVQIVYEHRSFYNFFFTFHIYVQSLDCKRDHIAQRVNCPPSPSAPEHKLLQVLLIKDS